MVRDALRCRKRTGSDLEAAASASSEACRLERVLKGIQQLPLLDARMPLGMQFGINAFRPKEVFPMCIPLFLLIAGCARENAIRDVVAPTE